MTQIQNDDVIRRKELDALLENQKTCLESISELSTLLKSFKEECKQSHEMPSIRKEDTFATTAAVLSNLAGSNGDKSVIVVEDLDPSLSKDATPIDAARASLVHRKSMHQGRVADYGFLQKREALHRRAVSTVYEKTGGTTFELWNSRRKSFAKNLGLSWENMQLLKEASTGIYSKVDACLAQM